MTKQELLVEFWRRITFGDCSKCQGVGITGNLATTAGMIPCNTCKGTGTSKEQKAEVDMLLLKAFDAGVESERERVKKDVEDILKQELHWCENNHPEKQPGFIKGIRQAILMLNTYFSHKKQL